MEHGHYVRKPSQGQHAHAAQAQLAAHTLTMITCCCRKRSVGHACLQAHAWRPSSSGKQYPTSNFLSWSSSTAPLRKYPFSQSGFSLMTCSKEWIEARGGQRAVMHAVSLLLMFHALHAFPDHQISIISRATKPRHHPVPVTDALSNILLRPKRTDAHHFRVLHSFRDLLQLQQGCTAVAVKQTKKATPNLDRHEGCVDS